MKDLIALLPCSPYEKTLQALFSRHESLQVRPFSYELIINVERDSGCRCNSSSFLRPYLNEFKYALVLFDFHGCGAENASRQKVEEEVEKDLFNNGWANRAAVVVVDPEIEAWVWSDSPKVDIILNWGNLQPSLRAWLKSDTTYWLNGSLKPHRPKEALKQALYKVKKPFSSNIFYELAKQVSLSRCSDQSFAKLRKTLSNWFTQ